MSKVPFPEEFGTASHLSDGECLDCGKPASVYTLPTTDGHETVVVHSGKACAGFAARFTPGQDNKFGPNPSPACDQMGTTFAVARKPEQRTERRRLPENSK